MHIKEEALEVLRKAGELLQDPELSPNIQHAISTKTDLTWLDIANTVLPIAIDSVENSQVILTSKAKNMLVTNILLPLVKDKLPWYVKPFAGKLISWAIDLIVNVLNKLFTKKWGKEIVAVVDTTKAEGTI